MGNSFRFNFQVVATFILSAFGCAYAIGQHSPSDGYFEARIRVELGKDLGQGLGSLFEVTDDRGDIILGAGFNDVHSSYIRDNNRVIDFYYKPGKVNPTFQSIGKPFDPDHNGARLLADHDSLITFFRWNNPVSIQTLNENDEWAPYSACPVDRYPNFAGLQYINNKRLVFQGRNVVYDGREIYRSERGAMFYYDNGRFLAFELSEPRKLLVYEWDPETQDQIQEPHEAFEMSGYSFIFGSYQDEKLAFTNNGSVYSYENGKIRQIRKTDGKSWQAYSVTHWGDDLVIGQYPTGSLFKYNTAGLVPFEPPIPVPPQALAVAREAQTLTIYGGDLYAGVWPWGELWRLDSNTQQWEFGARLFEKPEVEKIEAPFLNEMAGKPGDQNYWGQRIMNLVGFKDALYISTMNKRGKPYHPEDYEFLSEEVVEQYGTVHRMKGVPQVSHQITWKPETEFRFVYDQAGLSIHQDGNLLINARLDPNPGLQGRKANRIRLSEGVYGPFTGRVLSHSATSQGKSF